MSAKVVDTWAGRPGPWLVVFVGGRRRVKRVASVAEGERLAVVVNTKITQGAYAIEKRAAAPPRVPTLKSVAAKYLAAQREAIAQERDDRLARTTLAEYERVLKRQLGHLADLRLDALTLAALNRWKAESLKQPGRKGRKSITTKSLKERLNAISACIAWARANVENLPAFADGLSAFRASLESSTKAARQAADQRDVRVLTGVEVVRITQAADRLGLEESAAVAILLGLGLRTGELVAVRFGAFKGTDVTISESAARGRLDLLDAPKSGRARTVPCAAFVRERVAALREARQAADTDRVLTTVDVRALWDRVASEAEVEATPKACRDTFASWLIALGVSIVRVAKYLGHADQGATLLANYAADLDEDEIRTPPTLRPGQVVPDLLFEAWTAAGRQHEVVVEAAEQAEPATPWIPATILARAGSSAGQSIRLRT